MNVKQEDKTRLVIVTTEGDTVTKTYILIDSEEGQELIESENIPIDPDIEEF